MNQLLHWFNMGGYAGYVWSAYGMVCLVFLAQVLDIKFQRARIHKLLQGWFNRE
jgi:heme exporter protein D